MWRMTPRLATATLTATLALVLATATTPSADASAVQSYAYNTSGSIDGPSGNVPITFNPQAPYYSSTLTTPGSLVLGTFVVNPLPPTATLTYNNTPFTIDLNVSAPGSNPYPYPYNYPYSVSTPTYQYQISGKLNGSITGATTGPGSSGLFATVTGVTVTSFNTAPTATPPFPASALQFSSQGIAAAVGSNPSTTTFTAQILTAGLPLLPSPAPEPSTIAIFGVALAGLAWQRRRSSSRAKP